MDDVQAIRLAKTELREAYNQGDVDRLLSVFGDGFSDLSVGQPSFYGPEARAVLRHRMKNLFRRYRAHLVVTIISIQVQGSWAFDWGWHKLTLVPRSGGRTRILRTRYLETWQKNERGEWKIAIFLDNVDLAPRMAPVASELRKLRSRREKAGGRGRR